MFSRNLLKQQHRCCSCYYFLLVASLLINKTSVLALERKISVRANREELVSKGILLPESPLSPKSEPGELLLIF